METPVAASRDTPSPFFTRPGQLCSGVWVSGCSLSSPGDICLSGAFGSEALGKCDSQRRSPSSDRWLQMSAPFLPPVRPDQMASISVQTTIRLLVMLLYLKLLNGMLMEFKNKAKFS